MMFEIAGRAQTAEQSAAFLARQLFHASMPDYVRLYRACAFLAASVHYENDTAAHPNCNNAYGALIGGIKASSFRKYWKPMVPSSV